MAVIACVAVLLLQSPSPAPPAAPPQAADAVSAEARDKAIKKGFEFLDQKVWALNEHGSPQKQYTIAVTAWASLLAGDHEGGAKKLPPRAGELEKLTKYLENYVETIARDYQRDDEKTKKSGGVQPPEPTNGLAAAFDRNAQYVWPISMAAHCFAEEYARGRDKTEARKYLKDTILVLESAQQKDGGWGHDDAQRPGMGLPPIKIPKPGGGELTYPATLLAASQCALSGLGVAHAKLGTKQSKSLERGIAYFLGAQNGDGSFPYDPAQKHEDFGATSAGGSGSSGGGGHGGAASMAGDIEVARTPAAYFALACAGQPLASKEMRAAARAIDAHPEYWSEGHGSATMALMFSALAAHARGDASWQTFKRIYFPKILAHQEESGAFTCVAETKGGAVTNDTEPIAGLSGMGDWTEQQKVYVTSVHVLVLLLDRSKTAALAPMVAPAAPETSAK